MLDHGFKVFWALMMIASLLFSLDNWYHSAIGLKMWGIVLVYLPFDNSGRRFSMCSLADRSDATLINQAAFLATALCTMMTLVLFHVGVYGIVRFVRDTKIREQSTEKKTNFHIICVMIFSIVLTTISVMPHVFANPSLYGSQTFFMVLIALDWIDGIASLLISIQIYRNARAKDSFAQSVIPSSHTTGHHSNHHTKPLHVTAS